MKRDTRSAFRSRAKTMNDTITAAVTEMRAERDAAHKAAVDAHNAAETARVKFTREQLIGATAVHTRLHGWRLVRRINAKTISIDSGYSWAVRIQFDDVLNYTKTAVKQ